MKIFQPTRTTWIMCFAATALSTAVASGTAGLIYNDMTGRHWVIVLGLCFVTIIWTPFLALSLWKLSRQQQQIDMLDSSARAYGIAGVTPPGPAAQGFASKPRRTTKRTD